MAGSKTVISVGVDLAAHLPGLQSVFQLIQAESPEDLLPALERAAEAAIVVYHRPEENLARRVLETVARHRLKIPVIVLVEQRDMKEYLQLMWEGAYDYFELSSDPRWIERSLQWAIGTRCCAGTAA